MTDTHEDAPKVVIHPPTLWFAALILGYVLRLLYGGRLPLPEALAEGIGGFLVLAALALVIAAVSAFTEAGEILRPETPSGELLTKGAYRYSRNPIYAAMVVFGIGFGLATQNIWMIGTSLIAGVILHFFVVLPEETYLARRFGEAYAEYRRHVRRWI